MKTWEVMKMVQEDGLSNARFEVTYESGSTAIIFIDRCQIFYIESCDYTIMPMDGSLRDIVDWKAMGEPVDFITAFSSDKRIAQESRKEFWKEYRTQTEVMKFLSQSSAATCKELFNCKWYIEN